MKISEKLVKRLRKEFPDIMVDIPETETPRRLYHGFHQRSNGAWSWAIGGKTGILTSVGSQWSMEEILKEPNITIFHEYGGDLSVIPD
jgi:hypothetical protein